MQRSILAVVAALAAASLACSVNLNIPRLQAGPQQTLTVAETAPAGAGVVDVNLNLGLGTLDLSGGGSDLLAGEIRYNVADWKPTITNHGDSLTITQGDGPNNHGGLPDDNVVNAWTLRLGAQPVNLTVNAGAYEAHLALGGVPLRGLEINEGAADTTVSFDTLNPEHMGRLVYATGASSVTLTGLANANFDEMSFDGGAGDYDLDFSGDLQRAATVKVTVGLSSLRLRVPAGANARVTVDGGLNDVNTQGSWNQNGDTYETGGSGPLLTIEVDMGAGSLTLISQ